MRISAINPYYKNNLSNRSAKRASSVNTSQFPKIPASNLSKAASVSFGVDRDLLDFRQWEETFDVPIERSFPTERRLEPRIPESQKIPQEVLDLNLRKIMEWDVPDPFFRDIREEAYCCKLGKKERIAFFRKRFQQCRDDARDIKSKVLTRATSHMNIFGEKERCNRILYGCTPDYKYCFIKELDSMNKGITIYRNFLPTTGNKILLCSDMGDGKENYIMWSDDGHMMRIDGDEMGFDFKIRVRPYI